VAIFIDFSKFMVNVLPRNRTLIIQAAYKIVKFSLMKPVSGTPRIPKLKNQVSFQMYQTLFQIIPFFDNLF